jgi:hypothetical protein
VIDRKQIFLFRPKTNIRQEIATECSAKNEYSAQGSKHRKSVNMYKEKIGFLGWQLQVELDGHDLWATEPYMHKNLTMSATSFLSWENISFSFSAALAEYSFRPNIRL